jgi:hypothetical protein
MATTKIVPCAPALRSITGVEVMPISGTTWLQPNGAAGALAAFQGGYVPQDGAAVGIERINRTVLGGSEYDVVSSARNAELRQVQGLRIDLAVDRQVVQQAEARGIDVRGGQGRFVVEFKPLRLTSFL